MAHLNGLPNDGAIHCDEIIGCTVRERTPFAGLDMYAAERNVRPILDVYPQQSPDPIRQGDTPSRPARMPIVTFQAVSDWLGVQRDDFAGDLWAPINLASTTTSPGRNTNAVLRWNERVNVGTPEYEPYGSKMELDSDEAYYALMGS